MFKKSKIIKSIKKTKILSALICLSVFLSFSIVVKAEETPGYQLLAPLPNIGEEVAVNPGDYLTNMFYIGIGIAGILAVIMITIGGPQYMTTEAITGKSGAKTRINNAILGLILALASFLLLKTINTDFTSPSLAIEPVKKPAPTTPTKPEGEAWGGICRLYGTKYVAEDIRSEEMILSQTPIITETLEECAFQCEDPLTQMNLEYDEDKKKSYCTTFKIDCEKTHKF